MKNVAEEIKNSNFCIVLTGAGISTESGIPDFRSKDGIWNRYDINEYGYIQNFLENPEKIWKMLKDMILNMEKAEPNKAHYALAEMEKSGYIKAIITQNIDNLHKKAGSKNIIEFHGNFTKMKCMRCEREYEYNQIKLNDLPPKCECNGIIKPDIVFFGEEIPRDAFLKSFQLANKCDLFMIIGTSCEVYPASELPLIAKRRGAKIIEINQENTALTSVADYVLRGKAGIIMEQLLNEIKILQ
ncbi:MAG TPA: NAD-dependent deacylase [Thermoplasmatales archaeon]|nr:NAD-dependent deacylase [Thermoplasmatales archaeon]